MLDQWDSVPVFIVKLACDPINQHVEWGGSREEASWISYWCCSFFSPWLSYTLFFFKPPSFNYLFSSFFKLGSTRGNEFSYEVKNEICGAELLMHFCTDSTMGFSQKNSFYKFPLNAQCRQLGASFYFCFGLLQLLCSLEWHLKFVFLFFFIKYLSKQVSWRVECLLLPAEKVQWRTTRGRNCNQPPCVLIQLLH